MTDYLTISDEELNDKVYNENQITKTVITSLLPLDIATRPLTLVMSGNDNVGYNISMCIPISTGMQFVDLDLASVLDMESYLILWRSIKRLYAAAGEKALGTSEV